MMDRFVLFSADDHAGATAPVYREFVEHRYLDDFDAWAGARAAAYQETLAAAAPAGSVPDAVDDEAVATSEKVVFGTQLDTRLARLEQEGIVGEVLFPGPAAGPKAREYGVPFAGIFGESKLEGDAELHAAGLRAHNRWLAETSPDLGRQLGLGVISLHDVDAAVAEVERCAASGLRGLLFEGVHPTLPPLDDTCYDPIWSACEDHDLPIHFHAGIGSSAGLRITGPSSSPDSRSAAATSIAAVEYQWLSHRPLWFLVFGGVCERHPKLRIVFAELGADWAPVAMNHFRWYWELTKPTPHEPMYYYDRQVFFGASMFTKQDVESRHLVGVEKLMWGGDHPHGNGAWGCTNAWLRGTFGTGKVPESEARAIFGENAVKFYGLDEAKLRAIADRVGPVPADVLREPLPEDRDHGVISMGWLEFTH
jgi:predicted TIM-barrel fold metal-dependent hydrolase